MFPEEAAYWTDDADGDPIVAAPAGEVVSVPEGWTRGLGESQDWENGDVVVSVPPPAPARADDPAPVPPPVDALLNLVDELGQASHALGVAAERWSEVDMAAATAERDVARGNIVMAVRDLWAAGVEEGRRQRDAEIHANVFTSARLAAAEAGFGPAPESVTVSYERRASAYEEGIYDAGITEGRRLLDETAATAAAHAYELGIAEGRRQATEERTEEVERLQALLDHAEQYARDLQDGGYVPLAMDEADYAEETAERADG